MESLSRRSFLRKLALAGATALGPGIIRADQIYEGSKIVEAERVYRSGPAIIVDGKVIQPRREVPVICETDVLVVGGGCAGVMSALAAARTGAKVAFKSRRAGPSDRNAGSSAKSLSTSARAAWPSN